MYFSLGTLAPLEQIKIGVSPAMAAKLVVLWQLALFRRRGDPPLRESGENYHGFR